MTTANHCQPAMRIRLRRRADLVTRKHMVRGESHYVVKDPLALKYFRFSEEEFRIWSLLDGHSTDVAILDGLKQRDPACQLDPTDVREFAESLYRHGLAWGAVSGQGQRLALRRRDRSRLWRRAASFNPLAIRMRGIDAHRPLKLLYPWVSWFFYPISILIVCFLGLVAAGAALIHFDHLLVQISSMRDQFGPGAWLLLACTLAFTKILHEFGHALACQRCGGECHEVGVMLLVFTPCLYCDVSDSWLLPCKWRRAAIAAAGMYVEVALASLATFCWLFSAPGVLHYLALQVMLICSVSTLLFNGNPLARYDGYYILCDLADAPNLRANARAAVKSYLARWCLGIDERVEGQAPAWLLVYGCASIVYYWLLMGTILWFLHGFFAARGLEVVWQLLATLTMVSCAIKPAYGFFRFFFSEEARATMNRSHLMLTGTLTALLLGFVFLVPLPRFVYCSFETRPLHSAPVFVANDARLEKIHVSPGQLVRAGTPLADLESLELQWEVARLTGEAESQAHKVSNLNVERFHDNAAVEAVPQAVERLAATRQQLEQRRADLRRLTLRASKAGRVFATTRREPLSESSRLVTWIGSPLDAGNEGATLKTGDIVCEIGDPEQWEASLVIDQADIELTQVGQHVDLLLDAFPFASLGGRVADIAREKLEASPASMSVWAGGTLPTHTDRSGQQRPASASFTARVPIDTAPDPIVSRMRGTAKIRVGNATLASRCWQYLCRTFGQSL